MSAKKKRYGLLSRMLRLALRIFLMLMAAFVGVFIIFAVQSINMERSAFPEGELFALAYGAGMDVESAEQEQNVPVYTILQRQPVHKPDGILFLYSWYRKDGEQCIATVFVSKREDIFGGWQGMLADTQCSDALYTANLKSGDRISNHTVFFGLSGDASRVEIEWQDGTVSIAKAISDTYMAAIRRKDAKIEKVVFFAADGAVLHSLTAEDAMR